MKHVEWLLVSVCCVAATSSAQRPASEAPVAEPKTAVLEFSNEHVRVYRVTKLPQKAPPMHFVPPSITVFLNDATFRYAYPEGRTEELAVRGGSFAWWPGGIRSGVNVSAAPSESFLIIPVSAQSTGDGKSAILPDNNQLQRTSAAQAMGARR
jgi:hypothetical protein